MIRISKRFITKYDNQDIFEYTLLNTISNFSVVVQNYGGVINRIFTPDKNGLFENVVLTNLNFDPINKFYLGAITGRVAGRIKSGKFTLNNQQYNLAINNGQNHIHGGISGFNQKLWHVTELANGIELSYLSCDGEEGYPANIDCKISYCIVDDFELQIKTTLISDRDTIANTTNHSYFDLTANRNPLDMSLTVDADYYAPIDSYGCVINKLNHVEKTNFDLRDGVILDELLKIDDEQIKLANGGLDHPFVLNNSDSIRLADAVSGRTLDVHTTEPCCVIYTSNWLEPKRHAGICLETQKMPNAINWDHFKGSVLLSANLERTDITSWKFGVTNE